MLTKFYIPSLCKMCQMSWSVIVALLLCLLRSLPQGIVRALTEYQHKLLENNVSIFVRRGGPNFQEGLRAMREVGVKLGLKMHVFGPETHMTAIVGMALGTRPVPKSGQMEKSTSAANLLGLKNVSTCTYCVCSSTCSMYILSTENVWQTGNNFTFFLIGTFLYTVSLYTYVYKLSLHRQSWSQSSAFSEMLYTTQCIAIQCQVYIVWDVLNF